MEIIEKPNYNPNLALALGFFDGVHIAHQALISEIVDFKRKFNTSCAIITFKNNPLCELKKSKFDTIFTNEDKFQIFNELGVDFVYTLDFKDFINLSADEYLKDVLIKNFEPKFITTGFNHYFGKDKAGDCEFLRANQEKFNYVYKEIPPIKINSELVSTTNIKNMLINGDVKRAKEFLGRNFRLAGRIEHGTHIGANLGFKTANLSWSDGIIKLPYGVYKTFCFVGGKRYNAVANWGVCPTLNKKNETLEVHILNFSEDIYGKELTVFFEDKIRDEKKFNSKEELQNQIKKDLEVF